MKKENKTLKQLIFNLILYFWITTHTLHNVVFLYGRKKLIG